MSVNRNSLRIVLTVAQGALVLEALAELPFKTVFELIGELNRQANADHSDDGDDRDESDGAGLHRFILQRAELALIVKALGELPYSRVHALLANLSAQIAEQG